MIKHYSEKKHKKAKVSKTTVINYRTPHEQYIGCSKSHKKTVITSGVITLILIAVLFLGNVTLKEDKETFLGIVVCFLGLVCLGFANIFIVECLRFKDWAKTSEEGLELSIHNTMLCFCGAERALIPWDKIIKYTKFHKKVKDNSTTQLFLQLEGENKYRVYEIDHLQGQGGPILVSIRHYLKMEQDENLDMRIKHENNDGSAHNIILLVLPFITLWLLLWTFNLYEVTLIPYWFYMPLYIVCLVATIFACWIKKRPLSNILIIGFSVFSISLFSFLFINKNYNSAKKKNSMVTKNYNVIHTSYRFYKGKTIGYNIVIDTKIGVKSLKFPLDYNFNLKETKTVKTDQYEGFFGFAVFDNMIPEQ